MQTELRQIEAAADFEQVLGMRPDHLEALSGRAAVLAGQARYEDALQICDIALAINPEHIATLCTRASILRFLNRCDEALVNFQEVTAFQPDYMESLYNCGDLLERAGRSEDALTLYDRVLALQPNNIVTLSKRLSVMWRLQRFADVLSTSDILIAVNPNDASLLNVRGAALQQLTSAEGALASFERAIAVKPDFAEALYNRGNLLANLKQYEKALASFDQALNNRPCYADTLQGQAKVLAILTRYEEALASCAKALAIKPDHAEAHYQIAAVLQHGGKLKKAEAHLRRSLAITPNNIHAHTSLGLLVAHQGRLDEATAIALAADKLCVKMITSGVHYSLGALFARCGLPEIARKHLEFYLSQDLQDHRGGRILLAKLGYEQIPERASSAHLASIYERRARFWDRGPMISSPYRGDLLVAKVVEQLVGPSARLDILDAGCGTGLVGERIKHLATQLHGVDLSPAMLAKARDKEIYHELYESDLASFLSDHCERYDVVTCAATLIHFGDLRPVFQAAAVALRDGGLFVFTLYPSDQDDSAGVHPRYGLAEGGCYAHGRNYVTDTARTSSFDVELLHDDIHEYDGQAPITGIVVALRRRPRQICIQAGFDNGPAKATKAVS